MKPSPLSVAFYRYAVLPMLWAAIHTLKLVDPKIRRGIRGRDGLLEQLATQTGQLPPGPRIWFHSSSLGEFEQAKPIITALKTRFPEIRIIVSFFSPSGYEHSRSYKSADVITYIPFDTAPNAARFLDIVRPDIAVMVRYDIWPNHVWELQRRNIPILIANATMSRHTPRRFPGARAIAADIYGAITTILTVSESDVRVFRLLVPRHTAIHAIGDTRYDQVVARSAEARKRNIISAAALDGKRVVIAGSTWPEDEEVLLPAFVRLQEDIRDAVLILVPHEPTAGHLEAIEEKLEGTTSVIRFSAMNEYRNERVILVDSVGVLMMLYRYAHVAYVGGSFRQGVHNVLEPAAYGIPVVFGPRHRNSHEPLMLVERGGGFVVTDTIELERTLRNLCEDSLARTTAGERAAAFVRSHTGATDRVLTHIERHLPLSHHTGAGKDAGR